MKYLKHRVPFTHLLILAKSHQIAQKGTMTGQNIVLRRHFQSPIAILYYNDKEPIITIIQKLQYNRM